MSRVRPRPRPAQVRVLETLRKDCPACGRRMHRHYDNFRTVALLTGAVRLQLRVRRCPNRQCARHLVPYRPQEEGGLAVAGREFGLDVVALVGSLRYREDRSVPEIHAHLRDCGVEISERCVLNLLDLYDELVSVSLGSSARLRKLLAAQGRAILAIDGLQPHKGNEALWVVRECLSGEILAARSMLSWTAADIASLLREVADKLPVPVAGVVSDGQKAIRNAAAEVFPAVPHQLCQYHYLREAARPAFEADRGAKKELKKRVRGIRMIERSVQGQTDAKADAVRKYCAAVRSALDDDGPPPLDPPGLKLKGRLAAVSKSLAKAGRKKGACRRNSGR